MKHNAEVKNIFVSKDNIKDNTVTICLTLELSNGYGVVHDVHIRSVKDLSTFFDILGDCFHDRSIKYIRYNEEDRIIGHIVKNIWL